MKTVKAGVGVIVCKDKKVLIGQRLGSHGEGVYAFPGGHLEYSDAFAKHFNGGLFYGGEREVLEETGITCRVISPDGFRLDLFTTFDALDEKVYLTSYLFAKYLDGGTFIGENFVQSLEPEKCKIWQWVTLQELISLISSEKQKTWIPIDQVVHYLSDNFKI